MIFFKNVQNDYKWIHNPKEDIIYVRYELEKAIGC